VDKALMNKTLIALAILGGSLVLFFPMHYILIAVVALAAFIFLLAKPKICYYLVLIFSTYVPAFSTASQRMPFNQTDVLIAICFLGVLLRIMFVHRFKIDLRTKIDHWLIILLILYFFSGMTSLSHRGYQGFLQFGEVIAFFYMTVYFLRTKEVKLSTLIKVVLFAGLFQALYGILQSVTGSLGANFQSSRGYLGYLGIGSSFVWHGRGTFWHFNSLGPFLAVIFLFYLPIHHFIVKNKKIGWIILAILFFGVVTTYSRGSLLALAAGILYFMYQTQESKVSFLLKVIPLSLCAVMGWIFLKSGSYATTLSYRYEMWNIAIATFTTSPKTVLLGGGLKSYLDAALPYIPTNIPLSSINNYLAHSFYLYNMVEIGLIGTSALLLFFINNIINGFKNLASRDKVLVALGIGVVSIIILVLVNGIFDMPFNRFVFQLWLFFVLGIMYSRMKGGRTFGKID